MASWNCSCSLCSCSASDRELAFTTLAFSIDSPLRIQPRTCARVHTHTHTHTWAHRHVYTKTERKREIVSENDNNGQRCLSNYSSWSPSLQNHSDNCKHNLRGNQKEHMLLHWFTGRQEIRPCECVTRLIPTATHSCMTCSLQV